MLAVFFVAAAGSSAQSARPGGAGRSGHFSGWQSRGIGGGGALYSPTWSPFDNNEIYMATDMTPVYHTKNSGRTWHALPFFELRGGIESQVRFSSDPLVLYSIRLADDLRTPVKSIDGGQTWAALAGDPTWGETYSLWVDPASTERVLLSSYGEMFFSEDGGISFSTKWSASDLHIAGVLFHGQEIFVGTQVGLLVSDDGGLTFTAAGVAGIPGDEAIVSFAGAHQGSTTRLWAVTLGSGDVWPLVTGSDFEVFQGVYRLDWGEAAWADVGVSLPADDRPFFVAASPDDIQSVWLAGGSTSTYAPIVYRSIDGGYLWTSVLLTENNANIVTGWAGYHGDTDWWWGEFALGFAVSPTDADRAIITDLGFCHLTTDGGTTWTQAYVDPDDANPMGSPTPKGRSYRGVGVEDTSVWWLNWPDQETLFASFTDIRGIRSTDGGLSWASGFSLGLPHNSTYHVVEQPTTGVLFGATSSVHDLYQSTYLQDDRIDGGEGAVVISVNDGETWEVLHSFGHPVVWLSFDPADEDTLYASVVHSDDGGIWVTHDLDQGVGASWIRLAEPPRTEGHPFLLRVLNDGALVVAYSGRRDSGGDFTMSSGVYYSVDGGQTWLDRSDPGMLRWTKDIVLDPHDPTQNTWLVAVFSHWGHYPNEVGGLYRTIDRGLSWQRISDAYRVESCTIDPLNPETAWMTTEAAGLWQSIDFQSATPTFSLVEDYPIGHPVRVFFNPYDQSELWTVSFGGGIHVLGAVLFVDGFEVGDTSGWTFVVP